jgi:cytochrome d ubiquinol oxidase subunit II
MFDYETLRLIWWLLVGVLLIGFAVMDGHDMGVGTLLPFVGRNDVERRVVINTVGPHWDGNQVWFITAGGAVFAAWPLVYAAAFSGFYWALLAVLWALFLRPTGFDFRSKLPDPRWRSFWDWGLFVGSAVPALVFGVAFGNLLLGVPFEFDANLLPHYDGTFWQLLNPFGLLAGVVSLSMITFHGANYLVLRTEGDIQRRAQRASWIFGLLTLVAFVGAGLWVAAAVDGYVITAGADPSGLSNPLAKEVVAQEGAWFANYSLYPFTIAAPALAIIGTLAGIWLAGRRQGLAAFVASSLAMAGVILTAGVSMFPFVMPSSSSPGSSLTAWDATSSHLTLGIMFWAVVIFMPLIIFYTRWAYGVMAGKVTIDYIRRNERSAY